MRTVSVCGCSTARITPSARGLAWDTILKKAPLGALNERARADLVDHAHLRLVDLHPLHQRPNHLAPRPPVGRSQTLIDPLGEPLQLADHQAKLLLRRLPVVLGPRLRLQLRQ